MGIGSFGVSLVSALAKWNTLGVHFVASIGRLRLAAGQLGCFMGEVAVPYLAAWPHFTSVALLFPMFVITNMSNINIVVEIIHLNKKHYISIKSCT